MGGVRVSAVAMVLLAGCWASYAEFADGEDDRSRADDAADDGRDDGRTDGDVREDGREDGPPVRDDDADDGRDARDDGAACQLGEVQGLSAHAAAQVEYRG